MKTSGDKIKLDEPRLQIQIHYHSTAKPKSEEESDSRLKEANSDVPFTFWNNNFVDLSLGSERSDILAKSHLLDSQI